MPATQAVYRRRFLQFLAASPLFAGSALAEGPLPGSRLSDPLMWAPFRTDALIKSPTWSKTVLVMDGSHDATSHQHGV